MIICVCNNLSNEDIVKLVEEKGVTSSKGVYTAVNREGKPCSFGPSNINNCIRGAE